MPWTKSLFVVFHWKLLGDQTQTSLGGWALLCGYLSSAIVNLQHAHYSSLESRKTGSRWASDTSKQLWLLTFSIWEHRCSNLHDSPTILNVHGLPYLQTRIAYEYTLGYSDLPSSYKPYFRDSLSVLLKKHPPHLKRWFLLIRSIREALSPHLVMDRFFDDKALRRWIGLPIK